MTIDWKQLAPGLAIPPVRLKITEELVTAFAEMANDFSRIHFDDEFARVRGFPSAIAHGAIAASTLFTVLESWLGDWPRAGEDLQITFIAPSFRGDELLAGGELDSMDADRAVFGMWCSVGERKLVVARATVLRREVLPHPRLVQRRQTSLFETKR